MLSIQTYFAHKYYSEPFMAVTAIVALVVSIRYYGRHRGLRPFTYLILSSLVVTVVDFYRVLAAANQPVMRSIVITMSNIFDIVEFLAFTRFILGNVSSATRQRIVKVSILLYFGAILVSCIRNYGSVFITPNYLVTTIFLIPSCFVYFYELVATANPKRLKDRPDFWVMTGAFFLNCGTVPLFLSVNYLGSYYNLAYSLNYILFALLFILLIRAFLCPSDKPEPKEMRQLYKQG